ncbi:FTR1 family protein [Mucilaginibacter ginsenosidivorans]|nr:FTR1 family protein [Mucilaginibacter ginsenosidivorans]
MKPQQFFLGWVLFLLLPCTSLKAAGSDKDVQTIIHLLDYISSDYPTAVNHHQVQNMAEYREMTEFGITVQSLCAKVIQTGHFKANALLDSVSVLNRMIAKKYPSESISSISRSIKRKLIDMTGYVISPGAWPDISGAKILFVQKCSSCHGSTGKGDGPLASGLDPAPANFENDALMHRVSALQAYNTISLGVEGTTMKSFHELSSAERWKLAFYIQSLRFNNRNASPQKLDESFKKASEVITLKDAATLTDKELLERLKGTPGRKADQLTAIRLHIPVPEKNSPLAIAASGLQAALKDYNQNNPDGARQAALDAYLEGIEPIEARLKTNDGALMAKLEQRMLKVRSVIEKHGSKAEISRQISTALDLISEADGKLRDSKVSFWLSFVLSGSILLREGLEAFLIIAIMITIIKAMNKRKALIWLHGGWITAMFAGLAGWYLSDFILKISGQNREMLEGFISLFAVCVLTYVGFWLHRNSDVKRWKSFVENKINRLINNENMLGLAAFSFLVVFREAIESILFLKAIQLEIDPRNEASIGLGVLTALTLIFSISFVWIRYAQRIPVKQLFKYGSVMISVLAIIIIGKGVHSLQESGVFTVHTLGFNLNVDLVGIYSTVETILAQAGLIFLITGFWYMEKQQRTRGHFQS